MAAGDLITADYQAELGGVVMGDGTQYHWAKPELDVYGLPDIRSSQVARPRDHGLMMGQDYLGGRHIVLPFVVVGTSVANLQAKVEALTAAFAPVATPEPLVFRLPEGTRRVNGAPQRVKVVPRLLRQYVAEVTGEFLATDPRIYDNTLTSTSIALPTSSGGLAWPVAWPVAWGSATSGLVTLTNAGTYPTRPTVTFTGPLTSPSIQNVTAGLTWACTFDLASGDTLVVDFDARTVLLNGTASRYSYVTATSSWWELAAGANQVRIGATAGSGSATVAFRSAWL